MRRTTLLLLILLLPTLALSQTATDIVIGKNIKLNSTILGEERTIFVSTPVGYEGSTKGYPVMYVLDGTVPRIRYASGLISDLSDRAQCPEMIIVAIANIDRLRDMTPTTPTKNRHGKKANFRGNYGQADKFLEFFDKELLPFVEDNYRTLPFRIVVGHSGSGIFVNYAFLARNEMFSAYIAISPTFWWDEHLFKRTANEKLASMDLKQKYLYSTIGGEEAYLNIKDAQEAADTFEAKAPAELNWKFEYLRGETHNSQFTAGLFKGLRFIFDGWGYDYRRVQTEGLAYINDFYNKQTAKYGYKIQPSEAEMTSFGYALIRSKKLDEAIEILERSTLENPKSANAYDSLGDAYTAAGKVDSAIGAYEKAVALGKESNDEGLPVFIKNLEKARASKK